MLRFTLTIATFFFASCVSIPHLFGLHRSFTPTEKPFTVASIHFPNDTIDERSLISLGSSYRIHRFLEKCQSQRSVKIGFIGGSITQGVGVSPTTKRYSSLFSSFIENSFHGLSVSEINAGVSSTTSRFACSRADVDLFSQSPDMIVIEFAVNDFDAGNDEDLHAVFEGLVRQCLLYRNDVPVVLLFTLKRDGTNAEAPQIDVGKYYSLPMISYKDALWPLIDSHHIPADSIFYNDPHPNNNGHRLAAEFLEHWFAKAVATPDTQPILIPFYRYSNLYERAGIFRTGDLTLTSDESNWEKVPMEQERIGYRSVAGRMDSAFLNLESRTQELTLGIHMQPTDTSRIHIIVDDGSMDTTFTNYSSFVYTRFFQLYAARRPDSSHSFPLHRVRISHVNPKPFNIDYVLYADP